MFKKIVKIILVGAFGIFIMPNILNAGSPNMNVDVQINYKGGVSPDDFIVNYCNVIVDGQGCAASGWEEVSNKENFSVQLKDYNELQSFINYIKISKDENVPGYATKNYTIIYETAMTTEVNGVPVNNFMGDEMTGNVNSFMFEFTRYDNVPNNRYVISIYPALKSFGWNFDEATDAGIENGTAQLITDTSDSGNILIKIKEGDYQILPGTEVTIKLLPNAGYQLKSLVLNGTNLSAGQKVGYFTFTMPDNNLHFKTIFDTQENIIRKNSHLVSNADVSGDVAEKGNLRLSIDDITNVTTKANIDDNVTNGNVAAYLDLNLDNVIFKGTEEDVWSESLTDLEEEVTITLELGSVILDEDSYIVYEHDGEFHTIPAEDIIYNEEENTITFSTSQFSNYAIVSSGEKIIHNIKSGENDEFIMSFEDMVDEEYNLEVNSLLDLLKLTDQELLEAEVGATHEEIETIFNNIKNQVSDKGTFVGFYEISVVLLGNKKTDGPFTFKVKLTDELKKYNTFSMIYMDDEFNATETVITGTIKDDYIIFTLPHLSAYALVGSSVENPKIVDNVENNPKTGDDLLFSVLLGSISLIGLFGMSIYKNNKKLNLKNK